MLFDKLLNRNTLFLGLILLILIFSGIFFFTRLKSDELTDTIESGNSISMAFLISDQGKLLYSDVLFFQPKTVQGALLYVPGNLRQFQTGEEQKMVAIESYYSYSTPLEYIEQLSDVLGTPIPFYFNLDLEDITAIVDLLEGLEISVLYPLDIPSELVFLPGGENLLLDGAKTAVFLNRGMPAQSNTGQPNSDLPDKFIQSLLLKLGSFARIQENGVYLDTVWSYMRGNISAGGLLSFSTLLGKFTGSVRRLGITGEYQQETGLFLPTNNGRLLKTTVEVALNSLENPDVFQEVYLKIEVLNGTTVTGLAGRTAELFRDNGFDVVDIGNADSFDYEKTMILQAQGSLEDARRIADFIRCSQVISLADRLSENEQQDTLIRHNTDVQVILGKDFNGRYCTE